MGSIMFDDGDQAIDDAIDAPRFNQKSVYNYHGYRPVRHELSHSTVRVTGALPKDLDGVYLRNGTNAQFEDSRVRAHAFCGAGMIHQVQIRDGVATYSNFYVRNPRFEIEKRAGREIFLDFTDMAGGGRAALQKLRSVQTKRAQGLIPDLSPLELITNSTSIRYHSGKLYCLQEHGYAFVLDTKQVDGRLVMDGNGRLETWAGEWEGPFSAHPRFDPITNDMYNLSIDASRNIVAGLITDGMRHSQATVHSYNPAEPALSWLHDFFLTENYLIFPDGSVRVDMSRLDTSSGSIFNFDHDYPLRWGVIPRKFKQGDAVRFFTTAEPALVWHVINAWERPSPTTGAPEIVLFSPCFSSYPSDIPIHTPEEPPARVKKWVLDLDSGTVAEEKLLIDHGYERPSLNLEYVARESQYCYLLDEHGDGYMGKGVLKYDMVNERELGYFDYADMYGGEALFVPRKNSSGEDDGYLLDLLMGEFKADLLVLDAKTMKEQARLQLPERVPFGVHATWLGSTELAAVYGQ